MVLDESLFEEEKEEIHLRDIIKEIDYFLIFDDINNAHYELNEALDEEDTKTISLLGMTDEQLAKLKREDIKEITNVELLYRLAKININKLTPEQIEIIQKDSKNKIVIDKKDVEDLLEKFRECDEIYPGYPLKTREFLREYKLTDEDVLYVIKNLTVEDYYANTRNISRWHEGNHLIIFEPSNVKLEDGREIGDVTLYIKLDIDETTGKTIAMISFHVAENKNKLPYRKNKKEEQDKMKVEKLETKNRFNELFNIAIEYTKKYIEEGYELSDAIYEAVNDCLVYNEDIAELVKHYKVIPASKLRNKDNFDIVDNLTETQKDYAINYFIDELYGEMVKENKGLKESKLVEGIKTFLNDLGKEDIQYFKLANKFNYDIKQLRVDNKNKTYEIGQFKLIRRPYMTNNGAEFKRLIAELSARGYTEIGNELTESEDMLLGKDKTKRLIQNWIDTDIRRHGVITVMTREQAREMGYDIKKNWDGKYVAIKEELTEDLLLEPTAEDKELVKDLLNKYKGSKYEKVLGDLKAKYDFEETAKGYKSESMKKSKFIENLEEPEELKEDDLFENGITKVNPELIKELEEKVADIRERYGYDEEDLKIEIDKDNPNKILFLGELSYRRQSQFADELDKIIQKYDDGAYFDADDSGRWSAVIETKIEESVEGDKIAQDYIDSKNANYEADKQADREAKVELAKQGITEELSEFEKKAKDIADKLGIEIKLRGNDRFDLETLDRDTLEKFYKELLGVELGDVKGLKEDVEKVKEIADVEVPVVVIEEPEEESEQKVEEQPTEAQQSIGLSTVINELITSELSAIDDYNSAIVTFETEGRGEFTDVFRSILEDEQHHIGNLEKVLNELDPTALANIKKGQLEAETQLVDAEHPLDESLKK